MIDRLLAQVENKGYYTPTVVVLAILVAVLPPLAFGAAFNPWLYKALVMLVIACPCALVISTRITVVSDLTAATRLGLLVKGGQFLEKRVTACVQSQWTRRGHSPWAGLP